MTHRAVFHPQVELDVREAMALYDERSPGLGERFKQAFYAVADELLVLPEKYSVKVEQTIRTRLMRPFPYLVFYAIEDGIIFILTVQYAGRRPAFLRAVARERRTH